MLNGNSCRNRNTTLEQWYTILFYAMQMIGTIPTGHKYIGWTIINNKWTWFFFIIGLNSTNSGSHSPKPSLPKSGKATPLSLLLQMVMVCSIFNLTSESDELLVQWILKDTRYTLFAFDACDLCLHDYVNQNWSEKW